MFIAINNMEILFEKFRRKLTFHAPQIQRSMHQDINWNARMIGIKGARGVGKTTLLLQHIRDTQNFQTNEILYVSLDDIWFSSNRLVDLAEKFVKTGGRALYLDEVHRYPDWSQELKNIYDDFPELQLVFTGSSLLEILNARADLSRRAIVYTMQGLSFREYLEIETGKTLPKFSLEEILEEHEELAKEILEQVRPLRYFNDYLKLGYYPFYREQTDLYFMRINEIVSMMLEIELPLLRGMELAYVRKIKQLLLIIADSVPFVPNISKISERTGINRTTLLAYIHYLEETALTINLFKDGSGFSQMQKPSKIYLENSNLIYSLAPGNVSQGTLRETFFANQVGYKHDLQFIEQTDFLVDGHYAFEVGGADKKKKQISTLSSAYIAADDIEYGYENKIPLWLFGFLY